MVKTLSGVTNFTVSDTLKVKKVSANNSLGTNGQVLTTNGSATYWSTPVAEVVVNTAAQYVWTNTHIFNANVTVNAALIANGSPGTAGQVLHSNGSAIYWAADDFNVNTTYDLLAVANTETNKGILRLKDVNNSNDDVYITGAGGVAVSSNDSHIIITGAPGDITGVNAGDGLTGNTASGEATIAVLPNTGIIANSSGTFVNAAYIATIASNVANYVTTASTTNTFTVGTATYFVSNGNVGIGTSLPLELLHVYKANTNVDQRLEISPGNLYTSEYQFGILGYGTVAGLLYSDITKELRLWGTNPSNYQTFYTANNERMRIAANGNVGIDTTSPSEKLDVTGSIRTSNFVKTDYVGNKSYVAGHGYLQFTTLDTIFAFNTIEQMRLASNGNIGIGNTAPTNKLSVNGTSYFGANVTLTAALIANGSSGTAGQVLHSNGTSVYWAADDNSGGTVTSVATGNGITGGPITTTGTVSVLANTGIVANSTGLFVNSAYIGTLTANNTNFVGTVSAANVVSNAQLSANLANYQTTAGLASNVATLTSNNSTFSYGKTEGALNVNSALTANNSTNLGGVAASGYQTTAGLAANVATLTSNNSTFSYGKTEGNLNVNNATQLATARTLTIGSTGKSFNGTTNLSWTTTEIGAEYQAPLGVPRVNLGDPTVREMALFDGQFNNKTELYDINNLFFETSTDNVTWSTFSVTDAQKRLFLTGDGLASVTITNGTAYFRVRLKSTNYVYLNALYLYHTSGGHTTKVQVFRKAFGSTTWTQHTNSTVSDGSWPGHLYLPFSTIAWHPSAADDEVYFLFIPTWNPSWPATNFTLHKFQLWGGYPAGKRNLYTTSEFGDAVFPANVSATSVNAASYTIGATVIANSTVTNATHLAGVAAANYARTDVARTFAGITTFSANVILGSSGLSANGGFGTAGQVLHSNGTSVYWAADDNSGGTVTSITMGNGLSSTQSPLTTSGTMSVVAGTGGGLVSNSTGVFVTQGTGTVVNATGVHVNSTYIGTLSANNTTYVNSKTEGNLNVNNATTAYGKTEGNLNVNNASYAFNYTQGFNSNWNTDFSSAPAGSMILRGDTSTGSSTGGPGGTWWFQQNFRHTNAANVWGTQVAWGWEDNANILRTRNVTSATYGAWVTYLNSSNYNSYAPTLTGTGASGTWGINVTGTAYGKAEAALNVNNATTAYGKTEGNLNVNNATTAYGKTEGNLNVNNATTAYGKTEGNLNVNAAAQLTTARNIGDVSFNGTAAIVPERIAYKDTRATNYNAYTYSGVTLHLKTNTTDGLTDGGTYHGTLGLTHWGDSSGGVDHQLGLTDNGNMWIRYSTGATTWSSWAQLVSTVSGTALTANNATNLGGIAAASYQTTAGLSSNVATLTSNNSTFAYGKTEGNLNVNNATTAYGKTEGNLNVNSALYANASISNTFTVGTGNYFVSNGNFGIGTNLPATKLTVNPKVSDDNNIVYDSNTVYFTHQTPTSTTTLNDPKPVLMLARQGTGGQAYGAAAEFNLSRYENSGVNSRTRLDIRLADGNFLTNNTNVLTLLSNGNVGIGNTTPNAKLQVTGTANISGAVVIAGITTFNANIILGTSGLSSNGGFGTAGQVLTTNGTATYWAAAAGGGYYKGGSAAVGSLAVGGQNLFRINANTLNFNTTIAAGENAQATGPIAVAAGITLTVASGARVSIV